MTTRPIPMAEAGATGPAGAAPIPGGAVGAAPVPVAEVGASGAAGAGLARVGPIDDSARVFHYALDVQFGDCDPAGIVFYPNFYRWFDAAVHAATRACGLDWRRTAAEFGWLGLALAEAGATFRRPVSPGDRIVVETRLAAVEDRRLLFRHRIVRDETLMCEGFERRFVGVMSNEQPPRVKAIEIPQFLVDALTHK